QLSATPAPQGLPDLWAQFFLLDKGHRLGATEEAFKKRWFHVDREKHLIIPKPNAEKEIYGRIEDITIHMNAEDYLDMPDLIMNRIEVDLPPKAQKQYDDFEKHMIMELRELDLNVDIEASNAAVLAGKLLQVANGAIYYTEARDYNVIHDEKIEALKE
ncbi:ATP-dependent helicase, partial [Arthrospira platensis SPKY1]|nr:ATP-dependent helicase [Arthrospira platensis SPKY1]